MWINEDVNIIIKAFLKNKLILLPIFSGVIFAYILLGKINIIILLLGLIAFIDYNTFYISDILLFFVIIFGIFDTNILNIFIGVLLIFLLLNYAKKDKLGYGDLKLIFVLSLIYGINVFYIMMFSALIGLIFERKKKVPLGYYLFWGTIAENIWMIYFHPFSFF
ncbi:hypothetical protein JCM30566_02470 [Marinitoga arctica]